MLRNYYKKPVIILGFITIMSIIVVSNIVPGISTPKQNTLSTIPTPIISPTPDPFADLTIPYLRNRSYPSQLGNLQEVSQNNSYISYLTSYTSDGLRINGLLTKPAGETPPSGWPAIVFIHGYIPPTQYRTLEKYVAYVDSLAKNGFVVFKIDLRGHGNSEGEPGGAYYSSDYIIDTLHAYTALQGASFVDPQRIGLWGHSMAGNVVLRSVAAKPDIPAAVIWAGAGYTYDDLREYRIQDLSYRPPANDTKRQQKRRELFARHGEFNKDNAFWREVVPTNFLNDFTGAIGLYHAVNDDVVSINYSRNLNTILDTTSVPHELYEYAAGGHNISEPSFSKAMTQSIAFFTKHL